MTGPILVALVVGFILLRPRGRPLLSFGDGVAGRHVLPPVVLGLAAAGVLGLAWLLGLVR